MTDAVFASRDMASYERSYVASSFEPTQAAMRKKVVVEQLNRWRPKRLLEVGCGQDAIFNHYRGFEACVVVEPGEGFANTARSMAKGDARIRIVQDFLESAALNGVLGEKPFDVILISGLLHEVGDPVGLMAAAAMLMGPGSQLHVNVPNARSLHRVLAFEMGLIDDLHQISERQKSLQQHRTYDLKSLKDFCTRLGFQVTEAGSFFIKPFTHDQMFLLSQVGLLDERMLNGLMKLEKHLPGLGSEIYVNLKLA
ncbi:MAG: methyltransferase domain-containing protein [Lautropia sp.]|nr:methyltransferase domain-containing protein [Lautropia sp.]